MKARRTFTPEFKVRVALELISGQKTLMEDSREYWIKDSVILRTAIPPRHQFILELAWLNPAEYNSPYNK